MALGESVCLKIEVGLSTADFWVKSIQGEKYSQLFHEVLLVVVQRGGLFTPSKFGNLIGTNYAEAMPVQLL